MVSGPDTVGKQQARGLLHNIALQNTAEGDFGSV